MNRDILNDDKIIAELHDKLEQYGAKIKGYEDKKKELQTTLSDLDKKTSIDGISDSTKDKIEEVITKVKDKIEEIDSQIAELKGKMDEINDTLNPKFEAVDNHDFSSSPVLPQNQPEPAHESDEPVKLTLESEPEIFGEAEYSEIPELSELTEIPEAPEPPILSIFAAEDYEEDKEDEEHDENETDRIDKDEITDDINSVEENLETITQEGEIGKLENKIRELENKITQIKAERSELKTRRNDIETNKNNDELISRIDAQINLIDTQKQKLEETAGSIDAKISDGSLNSATRERLEEMRDEVQEKIDELQEKIDELQDKKDEYWDEIIDKINEKIDEKNDEIDNINEEIEQIQDQIDDINGRVDENVINEVKKSTGFDNIGSLLDNITNSVNDALRSVNKNININIPEIKIPNIKIPEINIPKLNIKIPAQNYSYGGAGSASSSSDFSSGSSGENKKSDEKYNVNFCSSKMGARIDSVCHQLDRGVRNGNNEHAANIIDDDPDYKTKWCANDKHGTVKIVHPHWVIIDFGKVKTFNYLKLVKCSPGHGHRDDTGNKNYDASAWRFEISSDRENWIEFNRETNDKSSIYEKNFGHLSGRYVRLFVDAGGSDPNNKWHGVRFYDLRLEMRGTDGSNVNLCDGASVETCCRGGWGADVLKLIDDDSNYNTKWYVEGVHEETITEPHWVIIDMGEIRTFNHVRIVKASEGKFDLNEKKFDMSAWHFEVSSDKTVWREFNRETNDQSSVYEKTFEPQTGRYIRLLVDAAESDPNNRQNHNVRIYDLRIDMTDKKENNSGEITFEDITSIAPFAKKETLDKLVDKLIATEDFDFNKIKSIAPFLSKETLAKLILKCSGNADINTIKALAPFLDTATLDKLVDNLNEDMDFEKIKSLAPFLSREAIEKCVTRGGTKLDMKRLKSLAPFLGSDYIDEIISKML